MSCGAMWRVDVDSGSSVPSKAPSSRASARSLELHSPDDDGTSSAGDQSQSQWTEEGEDAWAPRRCLQRRSRGETEKELRRRLPAPGDGALRHVSWALALGASGWLPRSRLDLSGGAGWRGDSGDDPEWPNYRTPDWPATGLQSLQYSPLSSWLQRPLGPLSGFLARQGKRGRREAKDSPAPSPARTRASSLARLARAAGEEGSQGTTAALYERYMMSRLRRYERGQRARLARGRNPAHHSVARTLRRWSSLAAACCGVALSFAALLVGSAGGGEGGALAAGLLSLAIAALLAAIGAAGAPLARRRACARWAAAGVVAALLPATLAAAALQTATAYASASRALASAPARWRAAGGARPPGASSVPSAYLALDPSAQAYSLSDAHLRLDLLGRGLAYWPLAGANPGKPDASAARGVTDGDDVPVATYCAAPLVDDAANGTAPLAWVVCHNAWAGPASCHAALAGNYSAAEAPAHEPLVECLAGLRRLSGRGPSPAMFFQFDFDAGDWAWSQALLAAPALRNATLTYGLKGEYLGATVLRLAQQCCSQEPRATLQRALAAALPLLACFLAAAAHAARQSADGHQPALNAQREE